VEQEECAGLYARPPEGVSRSIGRRRPGLLIMGRDGAGAYIVGEKLRSGSPEVKRGRRWSANCADGTRCDHRGRVVRGRLCVVACDPETGVLSAAANPRGMQGHAVGDERAAR
jgi:hypothetical protein